MGRKRKTKLIKRVIFYLFIVSLIALTGIIYLFPKFTDALVKTSLVEYGSLKVSKEETCYFLRQEKIIRATDQGRLQYYAEEGELLRKGGKIAEMVSPKSAYLAESNVLISYYTDGLEEVFSLDNMEALSKKEVETLAFDLVELKPEVADKGEALYKSVDNSSWYGIIWPEKESSIRYEKGKAVRIILPLGEVEGSIYDIIDTEEAWMVVLHFSRYYEEMAKIRRVEAEVITSDLEGLIIDNKNITSRDGIPGVLVKDIGGKFNFRPVSVITTDGKVSLVESSSFYREIDGEETKVRTVEPYDEIMKNPESEQNE